MLWWWKRQLQGKNSYKAIEKISRYRSPKAIQLLVDVMLPPGHLRYSQSPTRMMAATGLGKIGDPRAIPALIEALGDQCFSLALDAEASLKLIDPNWEQSPEARNSYSRILECFTICRREGRYQTDIFAKALLKMDDRRTLPLFGELVRSGSQISPETLVEGLLKWGGREQTLTLILERLRGLKYSLWYSDAPYLDCLEQLRDRRAIGPLILVWARASDKAPHFVSRCGNALQATDPHWDHSQEARQTVPALCEILMECFSYQDQYVLPIRELVSRIDSDWGNRPEVQEAFRKTILARAGGVLADGTWPDDPVSQELKSGGMSALVRLLCDSQTPLRRRDELLRALGSAALQLDLLPIDEMDRPILKDCLLNLLADPDLAPGAKRILRGHLVAAELPWLVRALRIVVRRDSRGTEIDPEKLPALDHSELIEELLKSPCGDWDLGSLQEIAGIPDEVILEWYTTHWVSRTGREGDEYPEAEQYRHVVNCQPMKLLAVEKLATLSPQSQPMQGSPPVTEVSTIPTRICFTCSHCGRELKAPLAYAGKRTYCSFCRGELRIPEQ